VSVGRSTRSRSRAHYIGLSIGGMIGQAFAIEHGTNLISALWSDTLPASPAGAAALWDERMNTVRRALIRLPPYPRSRRAARRRRSAFSLMKPSASRWS
jgi:hypothetical protein